MNADSVSGTFGSWYDLVVDEQPTIKKIIVKIRKNFTITSCKYRHNDSL
jgi:hypothetical protein